MSGKYWTEAEDALLRDAYARTTKAIEHLHLFPGRTVNAIRSRAMAIGIEMIDWRAWSEQETKDLMYVVESGKTIKACMHLFPGRTYLSVRNKINYMRVRKPRGHYSWVWDAIVRELRESPEITGRIIGERTGCCYRQIMDRLYEHSDDSKPGKDVYIASWMRSGQKGAVGPGPWIALWRLGNLPNAQKPARMTQEEKRRRDRIAYHKKAKKINPFATAAGLVKFTSQSSGRQFTQDMTGESLEDRRKAA